jgi:manganese oxidase
LLADEEGDWAMHCHKSHHTMNAMGHAVPTMIGIDHRGIVGRIQSVAPDYMVMGERGMADMGEMEMQIPDNTAPMMTGTGQYGPLEMGGMFNVFKVRKDQKPGDYSDPGAYKHPPGTSAFEYNGVLPEPARFQSEVKAGGQPVTGLHNSAPAMPEKPSPANASAIKPRGPHQH